MGNSPNISPFFSGHYIRDPVQFGYASEKKFNQLTCDATFKEIGQAINNTVYHNGKDEVTRLHFVYGGEEKAKVKILL